MAEPTTGVRQMTDKTKDAKASTSVESMMVKAGEKVSRQKTINTEAQTVRLYNVSKNDTTDRNYKVDWTFDFSGCTQEEILDLAGRSAVIAYRKHFRNIPEESIPNYAERTISVKDEVLAQERKGRSPTEKAKKILSTMSDEEKLQVLKELGLA